MQTKITTITKEYIVDGVKMDLVKFIETIDNETEIFYVLRGWNNGKLAKVDEYAELTPALKELFKLDAQQQLAENITCTDVTVDVDIEEY